MSPAPMPHAPQPEAVAAMDQAVDCLASTEDQALAAYGVLDATVRQWVASAQAGDAPGRVAGFVSDVLQALAIARHQLDAYQDAADDVVVTAGAAIGDMENPHPKPAPIACHAPALEVSKLAAFDAALAALLHAANEAENIPFLFEREFEQRFAASPHHLAWARPIFRTLIHSLSGTGALLDVADRVVIAAADVFEGLGLRWRDGYGLTAEAVAQSGDISGAFLNAHTRKASLVVGVGG